MLKKVLPFVVAVWGAAALGAAPFLVEPEASKLQVEVKATGHGFPVQISGYEADISVSADGSIEAARFTFAPAALVSDNAKRDRKMREWLEAETYPKIEFVLRAVEVRDGRNFAIGDLELHGEAQRIEFPFEFERSGAKARLSGSATIDYRNYGLEIITMFFMKVKPELELSFELSGELGA